MAPPTQLDIAEPPATAPVLPSAAPRRAAPERVIAACLALAVLVANLVAMPREFITGDPNVWLDEASALLRDGTLAIPPEVVSAMQAPADAGKYYVRNYRDGCWYSKYGVMNTVMFLPPVAAAWALGRQPPTPGEAGDVVVFGAYYALLGAVTALLLFRVTRWYSRRPLVGAAYVLACLYGTFLWFYQRAQYSELYQVLFFTAAFHCAVRVIRGVTADRSIDRAALVGLWMALAALVLTRIVYAVLLPLPFVAIAACGVKPADAHVPRVRPALPLLVAPPLAILAAVALVNTAKFGAPWLSGYHQWELERGVLAGRWRDGLAGLLLSERWSVLLHFPPLAFTIAGARSFLRRFPRDAAVMGFAALAVGAVVAKMTTWRGEWAYGPRYLMFVLPVLSLPLLCVLDGLVDDLRRWTHLVAAALVVLVIGHSVLLQYTVATTRFWAWYTIRLPLDRAGSPRGIAYLEGALEGEILRDLRSHEGGLAASRLLQVVRGDTSPAYAAWYERIVRDALREPNLYWAAWRGAPRAPPP